MLMMTMIMMSLLMMIKKVASPGGYGEPQVLCLAHIQAASLSLVPGDLFFYWHNMPSSFSINGIMEIEEFWNLLFWSFNSS